MWHIDVYAGFSFICHGRRLLEAVRKGMRAANFMSCTHQAPQPERDEVAPQSTELSSVTGQHGF